MHMIVQLVHMMFLLSHKTIDWKSIDKHLVNVIIVNRMNQVFDIFFVKRLGTEQLERNSSYFLIRNDKTEESLLKSTE